MSHWQVFGFATRLFEHRFTAFIDALLCGVTVGIAV